MYVSRVIGVPVRLRLYRYCYVYRHRVDKACLVSTSSLESLLCRYFTNDV
ncbi:hypothetical protein [Desulforhopalus vacuolatus]|nr:hypothetical protein [Desulforhopalus vacuolatus]